MPFTKDLILNMDEDQIALWRTCRMTRDSEGLRALESMVRYELAQRGVISWLRASDLCEGEWSKEVGWLREFK